MSAPANSFDRFSQWLRSSVMLKIATIGFLILLFMIPLAMVQSLVWERKGRQQEVVSEVSSKWGNAQALQGPMLAVPYVRIERMADGRRQEVREYAYFLPESLDIRGQVLPEIRRRGMYDVVVYRSELDISGHFGALDAGPLGLGTGELIWKEARLLMGLSDLRGVEDLLRCAWGSDTVDFEPGLPSRDVAESGMSAAVVLAPGGERRDFRMTLRLRGSGHLHFAPLGKDSRVALRSPWPHPSFEGAFLPASPAAVSDSGFEAQWRVLYLNRPYPQQWAGSAYQTADSHFGLRMLLPADQYQQSDRAGKYGILFIGLTFMIFFFVEILNRIRIHPIPYILVGLALSLFFVLLLSVSEVAGFDLAYLAASAGTIGLVSLYAASMFRSLRLALLLSLLLLLQYGLIYVLLKQESYSLLIGSLGLFAALAAAMWFSRRIDWENWGAGNGEDGK